MLDRMLSRPVGWIFSKQPGGGVGTSKRGLRCVCVGWNQGKTWKHNPKNWGGSGNSTKYTK